MTRVQMCYLSAGISLIGAIAALGAGNYLAAIWATDAALWSFNCVNWGRPA